MQELTATDWSEQLAHWRWPGERAETTAVHTALGRVLAKPVKAARAVPPGPVAAVSGLATAADRTGPGVYLQIGIDAFDVTPGQVLPPGTDTVLEPLDYMRSEQLVWVVERVPPGRGVLPAGSEFAQGQLVLPAGAALTGSALVACLAAGVTRVEAVRRPRVAIFPYGKEWTEPLGALGPGQVPETGSLMLAAAAQQWGAEPQVNPIVPSREQLDERLALAAQSADVLAVIDSRRQQGAAWTEIGDKPCLFLPGLPAELWAAALCWLRSLLAHWYGSDGTEGDPVEVTLAKPIEPAPAGKLLLVAKVGERLVAWPLPGVLGSYRSAVDANALCAEARAAAAGDRITVELLEPAETMQQRVLLAAPREAADAQPEALTPRRRVHLLTMPDADAATAAAAGLVHGRLVGKPEAWSLESKLAPAGLMALLQRTLADTGPPVPARWVGAGPAPVTAALDGRRDPVVDEPRLADEDGEREQRRSGDRV